MVLTAKIFGIFKIYGIGLTYIDLMLPQIFIRWLEKNLTRILYKTNFISEIGTWIIAPETECEVNDTL